MCSSAMQKPMIKTPVLSNQVKLQDAFREEKKPYNIMQSPTITFIVTSV